jgi:hypothetical protein
LPHDPPGSDETGLALNAGSFHPGLNLDFGHIPFIAAEVLEQGRSKRHLG